MTASPPHSAHPPKPRRLDLKKDRGLTVQWADGGVSYFPIDYLRYMSPSADARELRDKMARDRLTVLPAGLAHAADKPITAVGAQLVGNYAIRITFSDGHDTGLYSWEYLKQIDRGDRPPE